MDTEGNKNKDGNQKRNLERKPAQEFSAALSKDGKYWLFRDTKTWFIPVNYLEAIRRSRAEKNVIDEGAAPGETKAMGGSDDRSH